MPYPIKLDIGIITSMYLALSISVLFTSLMQSVKTAQFLNTTSLSLLFVLASVYFSIDIVPLTTM